MLRFASIATIAACVAAAPPAAFSFGYDLYNPQEDVMVQTATYVDGSQGAATGKAAVTTFNSAGNYDTTLLRNDKNALYMIVPRYGKQVCFAFNTGGPMNLPSYPTNALFAQVPVIGTSSFLGKALEHRRLSVQGGYTVGAYLDTQSGFPQLVTDTEGDGTQQYFRFANATAPDASVFDVPEACSSAELFDLSPEARERFDYSARAVHEAVAASLDVLSAHTGASYSLRVNKFASMGVAEFSRRYLMPPVADADLLRQNVLKDVPLYKPGLQLSVALLPASVDRVKEGKTTPVRDQSTCGGCWSFSTTASIETNTAVSGGGALVQLAPQNFIDCVPAGTGIIAAKGCNGGWPLTAMQYANATGGVSTEADYHYAMIDGNCNTTVPVTSPLTGYAAIERGNTTAIMAALVEHGSVVAIMQVLNDFIFFTDGVYSNQQCTGAQLSHGVTLVGYGHDNDLGMDYWLIKNSFGKSWGAGGYFRMQRGVNMCGIENWGAVPIVAQQ